MSTSFKKLTAAEPNTIMIVDALNLAFRWKHSGAIKFADDYISTVNSLKKSYKASKVIIASDMGSSSYRKEIFPDYKQNRKKLQEEQTPEDAAAFERFIKEFYVTLEQIKSKSDYPVLQFSKCEADDIAAYIVGKRKKYNKIWLISSDKDWDLLIDDMVSRFSYVTRKETTVDTWHEHYSYELDDHISIKCLTGDPGDNIPGVDGIGPVKAETLVQKYGSTYDIIANLPITSKYKYIANLNSFGADALLRNYKLMDLVTHCDEALGPDNCKQIDKVLEEYLNA